MIFELVNQNKISKIILNTLTKLYFSNKDLQISIYNFVMKYKKYKSFSYSRIEIYQKILDYIKNINYAYIIHVCFICGKFRNIINNYSKDNSALKIFFEYIIGIRNEKELNEDIKELPKDFNKIENPFSLIIGFFENKLKKKYLKENFPKKYNFITYQEEGLKINVLQKLLKDNNCPLILFVKSDVPLEKKIYLKNENDNSTNQYIYYLVADNEGLSKDKNISFFNYYGKVFNTNDLKKYKSDNQIGGVFGLVT